jgi:hypothetical protein
VKELERSGLDLNLNHELIIREKWFQNKYEVRWQVFQAWPCLLKGLWPWAPFSD